MRLARGRAEVRLCVNLFRCGSPVPLSPLIVSFFTFTPPPVVHRSPRCAVLSARSGSVAFCTPLICSVCVSFLHPSVSYALVYVLFSGSRAFAPLPLHYTHIDKTPLGIIHTASIHPYVVHTYHTPNAYHIV